MALVVRRPRPTRRNLLLGALGLGVGASVGEVCSLAGRFDHWRSPAPADGARYERAFIATSTRDGVVHIGHSTHLLCLDGQRFLTDPWFHDPAFGSLNHAVGPAVRPENIGALDAILITHEHPDHADFRAIDRLDKRSLVVAATPRLASLARGCGFSATLVLSPWETVQVGNVAVHAVPALHDSYEIGFVLVGAAHRIYFAGDSRLHPDLPAIAERFEPDWAILPVDGTRIRWEEPSVMTPADAVIAARQLGVRGVIPSHAEAAFGDAVAQHLLTENIANAADKFAALVAQQLPSIDCRVPAPGDVVLL
jgi:L-ascorbate metabolism protein UlaG (beta-lactamase superfamily)